MRLRCEIVQDLYPLYIDEDISAATKREIEDHLEDCENCRHIYKEETSFVDILGRPEDKEPSKLKEEKLIRIPWQALKPTPKFIGVLLIAIFLFSVYSAVTTSLAISDLQQQRRVNTAQMINDLMEHMVRDLSTIEKAWDEGRTDVAQAHMETTLRQALNRVGYITRRGGGDLELLENINWISLIRFSYQYTVEDLAEVMKTADDEELKQLRQHFDVIVSDLRYITEVLSPETILALENNEQGYELASKIVRNIKSELALAKLRDRYNLKRTTN